MTRWLSDDEQRHWRSWIGASTLLTERLNRDLQTSSDLTLAEYEVLVRLSESPGRMLHMSRLAEDTNASRSRLTHQIDKMEREGLVRREPCSVDRRGQHAVMTDLGWERLVDAAPSHVDSVRAHLVDVLSPDQLAALGEGAAIILGRLGPDSRDVANHTASVETNSVAVPAGGADHPSSR